jgi:hypothetical protein
MDVTTDRPTTARIRAVLAAPTPKTMTTPRTPNTMTKSTPHHVREDNQQAVEGWLPDGARFGVVYSAEQREWTGTLMVDGAEYTSAASGVFKLLAQLDEMFPAARRRAANPAPIGT